MALPRIESFRMPSIRSTLLVIVAAAAVGGCVPVKQKPRAVISVGEPLKADVWQGIASAADKARLANISVAWAEGLEGRGVVLVPVSSRSWDRAPSATIRPSSMTMRTPSAST